MAHLDVEPARGGDRLPAAAARPDEGLLAVPLDPNGTTVGRSPSSSDVVADDPAVSQRHMTVSCAGGRWFVIDLGARNVAKLNGRPLPRGTPGAPGTPGTPLPVADGDVIEIPGYRFTFRGADPAGPGSSTCRRSSVEVRA